MEVEYFIIKRHLNRNPATFTSNIYLVFLLHPGGAAGNYERHAQEVTPGSFHFLLPPTKTLLTVYVTFHKANSPPTFM